MPKCLKCDNQARPGRKTCATCSQILSQGMTKRRAQCKERGICIQCLVTPAVEGKVRCQKCLDYCKDYYKTQVAQRRAASLCVVCGKAPPRGSLVTCLACAEKTQRKKTFVPEQFRKLVGLYLPDDQIDGWLKDKDAFDGKSPLDLLSEKDPEALKENVELLCSTLYEAVGFATVPEMPTSEAIYAAILEARQAT